MPSPNRSTVRFLLPLAAGLLALGSAASAQPPGPADDPRNPLAGPKLSGADIDCADPIGYPAYREHDLPADGLRLPTCGELGFRHSSTDGRWFGRGEPLTGTSWLNRPYEFGFDVGGFVMTRRISPNSQRNNDVLAAAHLGWDWDHYWGSQLRIAWTSPELSTPAADQPRQSDDLLIYDATVLYYPWGDSRVRPYYRFGVGLVDLDYTNPAGLQEDNTLVTVPVGFGIKYQTKRWMALRGEVVDYITFGQNSAAGMQNITLTLGLEWRFGGRPASGWSSPAQHRRW